MLKSFTFSPFYENTYVLADEATEECIIFDPGCHSAAEESELKGYLMEHNLAPVRLLLTHAHLDHIFGCAFLHERYGLLPEVHRDELPLLEAAPRQAAMYGVAMRPAPMPEEYLRPGQVIALGDIRLECLLTPGHSPGHISFYNRAEGYVISGDALFQGSIGRTDLPGGDLRTLLASIKRELLALPDNTVVYSGHGPATTIGEERERNPFLQGGVV